MRNQSELSENKTEEARAPTKRIKKLVIPPKSPKSVKTKRINSLIRKLKLQSKSVPARAESADISKLPSTSTQSATERQTPEGDDDDNFALTNKSASETNLQDSWKSVGNLEKAEIALSVDKSEVSVDNPELFYVSSEPRKRILERTKSLESLTKMPAYGELFLDSSTLGVNIY